MSEFTCLEILLHRARPGDEPDLPLASILVAIGVPVIDPRGEEYSTESIGGRPGLTGTVAVR